LLDEGKIVTLKVAGKMVCHGGAVRRDWALAGKGLGFVRRACGRPDD
jgi:hypothetical protein